MTEAETNGKGFFDKVFHFLGIEHEEAAASDGVPNAVPEQRETGHDSRRGRLVSLPGSRRSSDGQPMSVVVQRPASFDDVQIVVDCLKDRRPVILSVELVPKEVARRLVDFVSGAAYALDGRMHRLGEQLFLFTPSNIGIDVPSDDSDYELDDFEVGR